MKISFIVLLLSVLSGSVGYSGTLYCEAATKFDPAMPVHQGYVALRIRGEISNSDNSLSGLWMDYDPDSNDSELLFNNKNAVAQIDGDQIIYDLGRPQYGWPNTNIKFVIPKNYSSYPSFQGRVLYESEGAPGQKVQCVVK